ncbi:MAG: MAPEG family protein [Beijerinckiaceae bacterium]
MQASQVLQALVAGGALKPAAVYAALIVLMGIALTYAVILQRRRKLVGIGDGGDKELARIVRVHGNFCENAPFALALLMFLPLLGGATFAVHSVGALFLAGRLAHAFGLSKSAGTSAGRVGGMVLTHTGLFIGVGALLWSVFSL